MKSEIVARFQLKKLKTNDDMKMALLMTMQQIVQKMVDKM